MTLNNSNQKCSKHLCNQPVYNEPDFSQPAKTYIWYKYGEKHIVVSYPFKPVKKPAYCYFHRTFPNYPAPEPFKVRLRRKEDYER